MGSLERTVRSIETMETRGAKRIAIVGLREIKKIVEKDGFGKEFNRACKLLSKARPTAVVLHNVIETLRKEKSIKAVDRLTYYLDNVDELIGFMNYKSFKSGWNILTHCHSVDLFGLFIEARKKKKKFRVYVTETRPLKQGLMAAKALCKIGVPVTYIIDSAAGFFIKDIDVAMFGCDSMRRGGVVNKIGTYPLAVLAAENKIPVYFVGNLMKLDKRKKFEIEERSADELGDGIPKNCEIRNPAFDITPWKYVTGVMTEKGLIKPEKVRRMLR